MPQQTIANGAAIPADAVVVSGTHSSGVCQDPNGCMVTLPYTQPAAPRLAPATTADLMGATPVPAQPEMCVPGMPCSQPDVNMAPYAQAITGMPGTGAQFSGNGADPYEVWRAQEWENLARGGRKGTSKMADRDAAVARSGVAASQQRVEQLMAAGVDYNTAVALAQRETIDGGGYRASGVASGAHAASNKLITTAAEREAERQALRGGSMSPTGEVLYPAAPGTYFNDASGNMFSSTSGADPLRVEITDEARANPLTSPALRSAKPGFTLERATKAADAAQATNNLIAKESAATTRQLAVESLKGTLRYAAAQQRAQGKTPDMDKLAKELMMQQLYADFKASGLPASAWEQYKKSREPELFTWAVTAATDLKNEESLATELVPTAVLDQ